MQWQKWNHIGFGKKKTNSEKGINMQNIYFSQLLAAYEECYFVIIRVLFFKQQIYFKLPIIIKALYLH